MDFAVQSKKRAQESQDYCAPHFCTPFPVALYLRVLIRSELAAVYVTYCYSFCFPAPVPGHGLAGIGKMLWDRRQNPACPPLRHTGHEARTADKTTGRASYGHLAIVSMVSIIGPGGPPPSQNLLKCGKPKCDGSQLMRRDILC